MEDKRIVIEDSSRTARRKQIKNLGTTAVAYLVELITNSDDSYKRLSVTEKTNSPFFFFKSI